MSVNDNLTNGYAIDAAAVFGPSAARMSGSGTNPLEPRTLTTGPAAGPVAVSDDKAGGMPSARSFLNSPVGMVVILLPLAYIAFGRVFGA